MSAVATPSLRDDVAAALASGDHRAALGLVEAGWADLPRGELLPLAQLLSAHGQNPLAARMLGRLVSEGDDRPPVLAYLAQLQWIAGDSAAAITTLRTCLFHHPQLVGLYTQLGMIHLSAGQPLDALLAYATAHSLDAEQPGAVVGRALAFRLLTNQRVAEVRLGETTARFALTGRAVSVDFVHLTGSFYEAEELAALAAVAPRNGIIADVGANLGNHAVFFLQALQPAELHLFEPNPACVAALTENVGLNPGPTETTVHRCGIGAARGELFFNRHDDLNNGLVPVADGDAQTVPVEPLDAMITHADLLKIDVEGMELDVLAGAERIIRESRPLVFIEVQARNRAAFARWLAAHDYTANRTFGRGDYDNVIAAPAAARAAPGFENNPLNA